MYNLNFNVGLSDNSIRNEDEKHGYHQGYIREGECLTAL